MQEFRLLLFLFLSRFFAVNIFFYSIFAILTTYKKLIKFTQIDKF